MSQSNEVMFSPELVSFIEEWKTKPGNLIMVLHKVQEEFHYISREAADKVAEMLDVPLASIWGVVSFYHFFKLTKPGKHNIQVCMGTACYLKGGQGVLEELSSQLKIPAGAVTEDGIFSLEGVRCLGCCGLAPVMSIGGEVYGKVTKTQIPKILAALRQA
ncbi:MAG TPA: NAD(P)H-dependent oxidoreductase subunit E [Sphaerochaeta sp.]|nr:NAD(P)H-dependent oxidoreductase subunit E [Spirochaetales bacterium]HOE84207.1 NAD(P)H-dependent oxidoreductase subunit E [Sphaerochaeta sp.]HOQ93936.1 NAD(P)H-dependent oxidoreductase subunit E [Sphaerochaeta sp.]HPK46643.1 NAD(P)H-dependent oxidoreductase subunit E [Sphaerochaeta sp.]HPY11036.1 NAD(P)H-dependent oxidoreductase subunit E [Sphaerochaeta sp.]